jgi:hypothetical protein
MIMSGRTIRVIGLYIKLFAIALLIQPAAFAGGFQLEIEAPSPKMAEPGMKDVAFLVRTFGCRVPANANLSGHAEGIVNGKRQSHPVQLKLTTTGVYAVSRQWPSGGSWVVVINGEYGGLSSSALVEMGPDGRVKMANRGNGENLAVRVVPRRFSAAEIDQALTETAARAAKNAQPERKG